MRIVNWNELADEQRRQLLTRPAMTGAADITSTVSDIINRIRREGDKALKEYTAAFDRVADGNILLSQQAIVAARLPLVAPAMRAYALYRVECGLRSSAVLGFVGLPTLGFQLDTFFRQSDYGAASAIMICYLVLIASIRVWMRLA